MLSNRDAIHTFNDYIRILSSAILDRDSIWDDLWADQISSQ